MFSFNNDVAYMCSQKQFFELNGDESFFGDVTRKLEVCRALLCGEFTKQFVGLDSCILWCTLLDPQYN